MLSLHGRPSCTRRYGFALSAVCVCAALLSLLLMTLSAMSDGHSLRSLRSYRAPVPPSAPAAAPAVAAGAAPLPSRAHGWRTICAADAMCDFGSDMVLARFGIADASPLTADAGAASASAAGEVRGRWHYRYVRGMVRCSLHSFSAGVESGAAAAAAVAVASSFNSSAAAATWPQAAECQTTSDVYEWQPDVVASIGRFVRRTSTPACLCTPLPLPMSGVKYLPTRAAQIFVADDCPHAGCELFLSILEEKGQPGVVALITDRLGKRDTVARAKMDEKMQRWVATGHEIASHTHTHAFLAKLPPQQQARQLARSYLELRQSGIHASVLVYPYGSTAAAAASHWYALGLSIGDGPVPAPIPRSLHLLLPRVPFAQTWSAGHSARMPDGHVYYDPDCPRAPRDNTRWTMSLAYYKQVALQAKQNNAVLIWMLHPGATPFRNSTEQQQALRELLDYTHSIGLPTRTLTRPPVSAQPACTREITLRCVRRARKEAPGIAKASRGATQQQHQQQEDEEEQQDAEVDEEFCNPATQPALPALWEACVPAQCPNGTVPLC